MKFHHNQRSFSSPQSLNGSFELIRSLYPLTSIFSICVCLYFSASPSLSLSFSLCLCLCFSLSPCVCVCVCVCVRARARTCTLSHFSHVQLCNPMDCSWPDSSVRGIFQARIQEWVDISSSRESSWPRCKPMSLESPALSGRFLTITLRSPNIYTYIFLKIQVLRKNIDSYTDTYSLNNSLCMFNTWHKKAMLISKHKFIEPGKFDTGRSGCLLCITWSD